MIASLHQELDELEDKLLEVEEDRKKELRSHELREDEMKECTKKLMDDFSVLNVEVCFILSSFYNIDFNYKSDHSVLDSYKNFIAASLIVDCFIAGRQV